MECRPSTRASLEMYPRKRLVTARILRALIVQLASLVVWPDLVHATVTATYVAPNLTVVSDSASDTVAFFCLGVNLNVLNTTIAGGPVPCDGTTHIQVLAGDGDDFISFGELAPVASLTVNGEGGMNTLVGPNLPQVSWNITGTNAGNIESQDFPLFVGSFVNVQSLWGGAQSNVFRFSDGASVSGVISGALGGQDSLDYGAYTTPVSVNLGANAPSYVASLEGDQEVPERPTTASGTVSLVFNVLTKTFDVTVSVNGIAPEIVSGFHIHQAPTGVNGAIIVDLFPLAPLIATGDGFIFTALGVSLPATQEASLVGGITYVNVHTPTFPGGEIRGQLIPSGPFASIQASGTATGTGGVNGIETVSGGHASDSLVGDLENNQIFGGFGNDTIVGTGGNDVLFGNEGDDIVTWTNGDGGDAIVGGTDGSLDIVQVNGAVGANDVFTIQANVFGGVDLARLSPGPVSLSIREVETLSVDGVTGHDTITVNSLAGIVGLSSLRLFGSAGNDTINAAAHLSGVPALSVVGGSGNDTLTGSSANDTIDGNSGDDLMSGGPGDDVLNGGGGVNTLVETADTNFTLTDAQLGTSTDTLNNIQAAILTGGPGNNVMDAIGFSGTVTLNGEAGADTLTGGAGINVLNGGPGDDLLIALASARSTVDGGDGFDVLRVTVAVGATLVGNRVVIGGTTIVTFFNVEDIELLAGATEPPTVVITTPTNAASTTSTSPFLTIGGTAVDDVAVTRVTWTTDQGATGIATGTTNWSAQVPIVAGTTIIAVAAEDAASNQGGDSLSVSATVFRYSLSEGATGPFFDLDLALANPNDTDAPTTITYLKEDGTSFSESFTLAANSRRTVSVDASLAPAAIAVSSVVESTSALPLVVERSMFWDADYYGSHTGNAVDAPANTWYFAEGSQGFFDTYVLLANSEGTPANVAITFLPEFGAPILRDVVVPPTSRLNVFAGDIPELVDRSFSISLQSSSAIIAERAMYFGTARLFDGGHESPGVTAPATTWFHAEGATGPYFDTYILVGNPNATPANVVLTFLLDTGQTVTKPFTIQGNTRLTVNIEDQDPLLANVAVSTTVSSDVPVISERAMYWSGGSGTWFEAHNSFGVTAPGTKWGLAEGRVGGAQAFETYILLANPDALQPANVKITYLRTSGAVVEKTYMVGPSTRLNVHVNGMVPELADEHFGALVEVTNGVPIAVERAMYSNALGVTWAAGTNAVAARLP